MNAPIRRERGIALVLVIWVVTLLMVLAGSFLYGMRIDARAARNAASLARAEGLARAAVARAAIELFKPQASPEVWRRDGEPRAWVFDGTRVTARLLDESAKIDLNSANGELLKSLFRYAGANEEEAAKLLDAAIDWRDPDSLTRPLGAEEADYAKAGLAHRPANYPFQSIEELQLVLGMRPEWYQRIAPMLTVYSRQTGVNPHLAPRSVLLVMPGVTPEAVDLFLQERAAARREGRPVPVFTAAGPYASYIQAPAATVRVDVEMDGDMTLSREAVVLLTPQYPRRPYTLLAWREPPRGRGGEVQTLSGEARGQPG